MKAQITLKSGAQIEFEVTSIKTSRDRITGEISIIEWESPPGASRTLHIVDLAQVAAIVVISEHQQKGIM